MDTRTVCNSGGGSREPLGLWPRIGTRPLLACDCIHLAALLSALLLEKHLNTRSRPLTISMWMGLVIYHEIIDIAAWFELQLQSCQRATMVTRARAKQADSAIFMSYMTVYIPCKDWEYSSVVT